MDFPEKTVEEVEEVEEEQEEQEIGCDKLLNDND